MNDRYDYNYEKERREAIEAGQRALNSLRAAQKELESARNWGLVDLFGGGFISSMLKQGKISEIDEETSRKMYETLIDQLTGAGYEHYEISNFARPGFRSRHNSSYWHEVPYIGIGAAAHSYNRKQRSWNIENIQTYIRSIGDGILPSESEQLDIFTRYNDLITTALRTSDGINLMKMEQEFGKELADRLLQEAQPHISRRLMKIKDGRLSLTREGLYISDDVMSDFMIV